MPNSPEIVVELSTKWPLLVAASSSLILFGVGYNLLVDRLGETKEGYVSLMVAAGVIVNLAVLTALEGLSVGLVAALLFVSSGSPMIIGEIVRVIRIRNRIRRETERKAWAKLDGSESDR